MKFQNKQKITVVGAVYLSTKFLAVIFIEKIEQ
jgi:hypothetical protein